MPGRFLAIASAYSGMIHAQARSRGYASPMDHHWATCNELSFLRHMLRGSVKRAEQKIQALNRAVLNMEELLFWP